MNRSRTLTYLTLVVAALGGGVLAVSCTSTGGGTKEAASPAPAEWTQEEKIAEGARLVAFGGCNDCHTPGTLYGAPDRSRTLAGSELGWVTPAGTAYASNLTPDPETGIGNWTEEQIATTLRTGHRPDGTPLMPPMPWPNLASLTDKEMGALTAYLKSLPPVKHPKPATLPPGAKASGPVIVIPAPGAWDAPHAAPVAADSAAKS
jgi:mono/diheme cytochrome c family protein